MKKILIFIGLVIVLSGGYWFYRYQKYQKESVPVAVDLFNLDNKNSQQVTTNNKDSNGGLNTVSNELSLPKNLNLKMVFYSQAPFGNWDYPWQEACEEASVLLVANTYLQKNWSADDFNDQILKMVDWEKKRFGDYKHTSVKETSDMINEYFGFKTKIYENPNYEDVKKVLNEGHLIIMTFAGKHLGNPNYRNGGPNYHAMVIKGYKEGEKIITEDVGTKHGENYVYSWGTIQNALHDYAEPIEAGGKRMIEILPSNNP